MIKKTTLANFQNGEYAGQYDWQGGIPLTVGETVVVHKDAKEMTYKLTDKKTTLQDLGDDQIVTTEYFLELAG